MESYLADRADKPTEQAESGGCYALILAGGRSRRMGSDKALLELEGETLISRAVRFWRTSGRVEGVLAAVGEQGHLASELCGAAAIPDIMAGRGPMAGILSAFRLTDAEALYVSAVDMPALRREAIMPVPEADRADACVYVKDGLPEPLFGVYRRSVADAAEELLLSGSGRMSELLSRVRTEYREIRPEWNDMFRNINSPEDLIRTEKQKKR